jgi:hypothetical protein
MSMNANVLPRSGLIGTTAMIAEVEASRARTGGEVLDWTPEDFARDQIRGLVRRVFFSNMGKPGEWIRQVVFSAVEDSTDLGEICDQVGHALALETSAEVAIVKRNSAEEPITARSPWRSGSTSVKAFSTHLAPNLWSVPEAALQKLCPEPSNHFWLWALAELRNDFEYALIQGPAASVWTGNSFLGQLADGVILVLEAHNTRRVTARNMKQVLEGTQSRILGTVLSQRTFPLPEKIYRRL